MRLGLKGNVLDLDPETENHLGTLRRAVDIYNDAFTVETDLMGKMMH